MKPLTVLSLFDGCSCGMLALQRAGIPIKAYFASEIDKYAMQISKKNWGDKIIQLGDVLNWRNWNLPQIDVLIAGSPCQGFSFAGKGLNFDDPRSKLFFEYDKIRRELKPPKYLLENTPMKKEALQIITDYMEVEPVMINSALVSAQHRKRWYWANWEFPQPEDKNILLEDIALQDAFPVALHNLYGGFKEDSVRVFDGKSPTIRTSAGGGHIPSFVSKDLSHSPKAIEYMDRKRKDGRTGWDFAHYSDIRKPKSSAVVANFFKGVPYNVFKDWDVIRKFHPIECERLQTLPDNYTDGVSPTQRYKMIGNGWTVDVIAHIFSHMKE